MYVGSSDPSLSAPGKHYFLTEVSQTPWNHVMTDLISTNNFQNMIDWFVI